MPLIEVGILAVGQIYGSRRYAALCSRLACGHDPLHICLLPLLCKVLSSGCKRLCA